MEGWHMGGGVRINFVMVKISMDKNDIHSMLLMFMFKSLINKQLWNRHVVVVVFLV